MALASFVRTGSLRRDREPGTCHLAQTGHTEGVQGCSCKQAAVGLACEDAR